MGGWYLRRRRSADSLTVVLDKGPPAPVLVHAKEGRLHTATVCGVPIVRLKGKEPVRATYFLREVTCFACQARIQAGGLVLPAHDW